MVIVLGFIILVLAVLLVCSIYDGHCRVEQWQSRYETAKECKRKEEARAESFHCMYLQAMAELGEKEMIIAELKDKNKQLKERMLKNDIEGQKTALNKEGC